MAYKGLILMCLMSEGQMKNKIHSHKEEFFKSGNILLKIRYPYKKRKLGEYCLLWTGSFCCYSEETAVL